MIAEEVPLLPVQLFQGVSPQRITIMSRASRMQAFTAQLNDDAYLDALLDEGGHINENPKSKSPDFT